MNCNVFSDIVFLCVFFLYGSILYAFASIFLFPFADLTEYADDIRIKLPSNDD